MYNADDYVYVYIYIYAFTPRMSWPVAQVSCPQGPREPMGVALPSGHKGMAQSKEHNGNSLSRSMDNIWPNYSLTHWLTHWLT